MVPTLVSPVLVGRDTEVAMLRACAAEAARGNPAVVLVGGEAGVGKTRLVATVGDELRASGWRVLHGGCVELGAEGLPLAPLVDVLRGVARAASPTELDTFLGPARRELARLLPELAPDPETLPASTGAQLLELVLGVVDRLAAQRPLALVVEDLHWADRSTLDLVAFLVRSLQARSILLVITHRTDELHRRHPLRPLIAGWERARAVRRLDLDRFDRATVAELLAVIRSETPPAELVDVVFERSEGNAFLVEEMLGVIAHGGDPGALPPSLRDLLLTRVDKLSEPGQRIVRAAAVGGRIVPERLLRLVAEVDRGDFTALREVVEHSLLVVGERGQDYAFRHALARDAVYDDMLPGERVALHSAYAEALKTDPSLVEDADAAAALAHHCYAALDLPGALVASVRAGERAASAFAGAEALQHFERALEVWPRVPDAEALVGFDHVEMLRLAAATSRAIGTAERAVSLIDQALREAPAEATERRALLLTYRAMAGRDRAQPALALADAEAALALLPEDQPTVTLAKVLATLAHIHQFRADTPSALDVATRAVRVATAAGAEAQRADALVTLGTRAYTTDDPDTGLRILQEGVQAALEIGDDEIVLRGYTNLADLLEQEGRHDEAIDVATKGLDRAFAIGRAREMGCYLTGNIAEPLIRRGDWAAAQSLLDRSLALAPEGIFAATVLELRVELAISRGEYDEARELCRSCRQHIGAVVDVQFTQPMDLLEARLAHAGGDLATAGDLVERSLHTGPDFWTARYTWPLVWFGMRVAAESGDHARADRLDALASTLVARTPTTTGYQALTIAERSRLDGMGEVAVWQAAVDAWREAEDPYPLAYALLRLAEAAAAEGRRELVAATLPEAGAVARRLGAIPLIEEISALGRRTGITDDEPDDEVARLGLTAREREVLALLAAGRSNRSIAESLFISPKTASVHVSNILAKLGVSGRGEAAAVAHRLGLVG